GVSTSGDKGEDQGVSAPLGIGLHDASVLCWLVMSGNLMAFGCGRQSPESQVMSEPGPPYPND
ncbi:MAG: hypothetical protein RL357_2035, partial [Pseudomonadota bacterium]